MLLTMMPAMALASSVEEALTQTGGSLNSYEDLDESDWFYKDALYVMEKGLFKGISDTLFSPNGTMTHIRTA